MNLNDIIAHQEQINPNNTEEINKRFYEKYGAELTEIEPLFNEIFNSLELNVSPLTQNIYIGITNDNGWVTKKEIPTGSFIKAMVDYLSGGDTVEKGFRHQVNINNEHGYDILIINPKFQVKLLEQNAELYTPDEVSFLATQYALDNLKGIKPPFHKWIQTLPNNWRENLK